MPKKSTKKTGAAKKRQSFTFLSVHKGFHVMLGGEFRPVHFRNGVFTTTDEKLAKALQEAPTNGKYYSLLPVDVEENFAPYMDETGPKMGIDLEELDVMSYSQLKRIFVKTHPELPVPKGTIAIRTAVKELLQKDFDVLEKEHMKSLEEKVAEMKGK